MLGVAALTRQDAQRYFEDYAGAIRVLRRRALPGAAPHARRVSR